VSVRGYDVVGVRSESGLLNFILALFERYGYGYTYSIVSPNSIEIL
jgi:hypothetical protein